MFSCTLLEIYYSCCDYWSKPNVHISEVSFAIFNVRKVTGFNKYIGVTALSIYCGCYGMMLVSLTTHFYYRFLSVTLPSKLSRFAVKNFPIWALLVLMSYLIWFGLTYFVNGSSSMKDQVLIPEFKRDYCMQPDDFSRQIQILCVLRKLQSQEPSGFISNILQFSWIDVSCFHLTIPLYNLNQLPDFRFKESNIGVLVDCQSNEMFVSTEEIDLFEQTSFPLELYGELTSRRYELNSVPGMLESELASDGIDRLDFFADSKPGLPILNPHNQTASEPRETAISMSKTRRIPFELSSMELHLDTIDTSLQPE
ncbi:hypothetical protein GCK72_004766 [Caenorhabditis remanei]|uniref:Uncharacterized protein n=1 Tax=Caenorhabditis remanei TaxID=31234 RepID=A0A6A5HDB3_CAERE|nr:hypothetical protein GCK72_004766 [Caenorhabditis remanei]KAF1764816.1 hypothetical protein GCK72_004766 [Caenorhabditis remanei]